MKRAMSFLLALSLIVGLCGTLFVSAEEFPAEIAVTGVTEPVVGQVAAMDGATCNIPGVTVELEWGRYDHVNDQITLPAEGSTLTFEAAKIYRLNVWLTATEPTFDYDAVYSVNGVQEDNISFYSETEVVIHVEYTTEGITVLDTLNITGIGNTEVGSVMTTANLQAEGAVIFNASWSFDGEYQEGVSVFEEGMNYLLDVYARPVEGYAFSEDMVITFEGEPYDILWNQIAFSVNAGYYVRHAKEPLYGIRLSDLPAEIAAGAAPTLEVSVQDGNAAVKDVYWVAADKTTKVTAFEDGKAYYLAVELEADDDYTFCENTSVYSGNWDMYSTNEAVEGSTHTAYFRYSLLEEAEKADITISGLEAGLKASDVKVTVSGVKAEVSYLEVYDAETYDTIVDGVFKEGKTYLVDFTLLTDNTYEFGYETEVTVNGKEVYNYYTDGTYLNMDYYVSFLKKIDTVTLTVAEPTVGATPGELKVPNGANYTVEYSWVDSRTWETADTFQDGHRYMLNVSVYPNEGYDFAEDAKVTLNGVDPERCYVDDYRFAYVDLQHSWSFADSIDKIELPGAPESIEVGSTPAAIDMVDNDKYTVEAEWIDTETSDTVTTFEDGKIYFLTYTVMAKEGYEITKDTKVLLGDEEYTGLWDFSYHYGYAIKSYALGMEIIDRVDITVTEPSLGAKPGEPTVPADAKYELSYTGWEENDTGDTHDETEEIKTFSAGKHNFLTLSLTAAEGYAFDETTKFYVNGVEVEPVIYWVLGADSNVALHYEPLTENTGDQGGNTGNAGNTGNTGTNAPTGDEFPMAAVIVLMVLAMAGAAVVIIGKKKFAK